MKVVIKKDPVKGRGVYASEKISKGELIEVCELIIVDMENISGELERYAYYYTRNQAAIALGNGSLFNHSQKANSEFSINYKQQRLYIRAKKTIKPGDEITINYRYDAPLRKKYKLIE